MSEQGTQGSSGPPDDEMLPEGPAPLEDEVSPTDAGLPELEDEAPPEEVMPPESEMPPGFEYEEEESDIPPEYRILFPDDGVDGLTKITETPSKMILPLVRMRIIDEAYNANRSMSLLELFVQEFDRRMISRDRKGRLEAVRVLQGVADAAAAEDEAQM